MQDKPFTCDKCGICCKHIGHIDELKHLDNGKGECTNLTEGNTCKVYETRPVVCNVKALWKRDYRKRITWTEFVRENENGCKKLKSIQMK